MAENSDKRQTEPRVKIQSLALNGLFVLALFYTIYLGRPVLLPLAMAFFFAFLLRPVVRLLKKIRVPEVAAAGLVLLTFLAVIAFGISHVSDSARHWIEKAPQNLRDIGKKLEGVISPVKKATKTAEELKKLTGPEKGPAVTVKPGPGLAESFVSGAREFLAEATIMLILLFFILASGDLFVIKLMKMYPAEEKKKQVSDIVRQVEYTISRYLLTVTIINCGEGAIVGLALYLIGMPDPVLWGVMAALLVYIPYLGPLVGITIVGIVALFSLELPRSLLAPAIYLAVEILQGQVLTPMILGKRFEMNPLIIFVWLVVWGAMWGVVGAIMAVPMLTIFKILCDRIEPLKPVSLFLSD